MTVYVLLQWNTHDGPEECRVITDEAEARAWQETDKGGRAVVKCVVGSDTEGEWIRVG